MRVVGDDDIGASKQVVTNGDTVGNGDMASMTEETAVANGKRGERASCLPDSELQAWFEDVVISDSHETFTRQVKGFPLEDGVA